LIYPSVFGSLSKNVRNIIDLADDLEGRLKDEIKARLEGWENIDTYFDDLEDNEVKGE